MNSTEFWVACTTLLTLFVAVLMAILILLLRWWSRTTSSLLESQVKSVDGLARLLASRDPLTYQMLQRMSPLSPYNPSSPDQPAETALTDYEEDDGEADLDDPAFADINPEFLITSPAYDVGRRE